MPQSKHRRKPGQKAVRRPGGRHPATDQETIAYRDALIEDWLQGSEIGRELLEKYPLSEACDHVRQLLDKRILRMEVQDEGQAGMRVRLRPATIAPPGGGWGSVPLFRNA